jgi:hypothetical protein
MAGKQDSASAYSLPNDTSGSLGFVVLFFTTGKGV